MANIGSIINKALSNGSIDRTEVGQMMKQVQAQKDPAKADDVADQLRQLIADHGDAFEPAAKKDLTDFLSTQSSGKGRYVPTAEPDLMKDSDPATRYTSVTGGQLYVDGINYDDITQGEAGDCYYLSSIAAVAETHPDIIKDAIKDNGNGTYTVRFFEKGKKGAVKPVYVTVDGKLPATNDGNIYASSRNNAELWGPVMEKAFAQWKGGYEQIGEGGAAKDALFALAGHRTDYTEHVAKADPEQLWSQLKSATDNHQPMVTGTFDEGTRKDINWDKVGLFDGHDYTLLGASEENGQRYVTLRDPHGGGDDEIKGGTYYSDNGQFKMPYAEYRKYFDDLDIMKQ